MKSPVVSKFSPGKSPLISNADRSYFGPPKSQPKLSLPKPVVSSSPLKPASPLVRTGYYTNSPIKGSHGTGKQGAGKYNFFLGGLESRIGAPPAYKVNPLIKRVGGEYKKYDVVIPNKTVFTQGGVSKGQAITVAPLKSKFFASPQEAKVGLKQTGYNY